MDTVAIENSIWVCGAGEMIAVSSDGGKQWQLKHQVADGNILLSMVFVNRQIGYAAGTNGLFLSTTDGGEVWTLIPGSTETILNLSFSSPVHGIRQTRSKVEFTHDAGRTWTEVDELRTDPEIRPFTNILSIASLDSEHAAIALHQNQGENIFVITKDGGKTWKAIHLDNTFAGTLFVHGREFWAFGIEYLEREKGGGYSAPVGLHSADGENWTHGVRAPNEFNSCRIQGCILYDGAIADLYGESARFLATKADGSLQSNWAFASGVVCSLGLTLKCAPADWTSTLPPRPEEKGGRHSAGVGIPLAYETPLNLVSRCLSCPLGSFSVPKQIRGMASVEVSLNIKKDGTAGNVRVGNAPLPLIEAGIHSIVENWLFEPARDSRGPTEVQEKLKLNVLCMTFPDNDEGTCTVTGPPPKVNK
jgi:hypothetical protein